MRLKQYLYLIYNSHSSMKISNLDLCNWFVFPLFTFSPKSHVSQRLLTILRYPTHLRDICPDPYKQVVRKGQSWSAVISIHCKYRHTKSPWADNSVNKQVSQKQWFWQNHSNLSHWTNSDLTLLWLVTFSQITV